MTDAKFLIEKFLKRFSKYGMDVFDREKAKQAREEQSSKKLMPTLEAFNQKCEVCNKDLWFVPAENRPTVCFYKANCCERRYAVSKDPEWRKEFAVMSTFSITRELTADIFDRIHTYYFSDEHRNEKQCSKCGSKMLNVSGAGWGSFCLNVDCDNLTFYMGG